MTINMRNVSMFAVMALLFLAVGQFQSWTLSLTILNLCLISAIIVPYRDLHPSQNRAKHLQQFVPHMKQFLSGLVDAHKIGDYHIYIIEQSDDNRKFNRGKLLNIGFDFAFATHSGWFSGKKFR